ncbi:MAG: DegT/DnrJ/EryC1/StrS family aminotransferase [Saprospiraceae bacterium]
MVDLNGQYQRIKAEVDASIQEVLNTNYYIGGPKVKSFQDNLSKYLSVKHVIPCANGTDALQIALMALGLEPDDEVIVPAFTYVATAEVIALLRLKPVMVEVDPDTFNLTAEIIESAITERTKAIVPVHLYGQSCDMQPIVEIAQKYNLRIVEDNAQAIGATYTFPDGTTQSTGTIGDIGTTSFYPSKNLGAYGDGGAIFTNNDYLAEQLKMIANHGQQRRYYHDVVGCNSRLDALQAAVLDIKLKYLDDYCAARQAVAGFYDKAFVNMTKLQIPARQYNSTHVFHQYTLRVLNGKRDELKAYLQEKGIPSVIYYPLALHQQQAYSKWVTEDVKLPISEQLCSEVLSLPMHTELTEDTLSYISNTIKKFFN